MLPPKAFKTVIVGATGLVGRLIAQVLEERNFPVSSLHVLASERSQGVKFSWKNQTLSIEKLSAHSFREPQFVFFAAGSAISREYVPIALREGAVVIDNASCFRMDQDVPLIVPEVNLKNLEKSLLNGQRLIANPNCTTAQLVLALKPLLNRFGLKKVTISSYQAVSGQGQKGMQRLIQEQNREPEAVSESNEMIGERMKSERAASPFPYAIADNCIPQIDVFQEEGYTGEEWKVMKETRKILNCSDLRVSATCVRVPVRNGHSISVQVETEQEIPSLNEVRKVWSAQQGLVVQDFPIEKVYPMPKLASGKDDVFVGRLRWDLANEHPQKGLLFWVVGDNLRKGAALNAVQIAEAVVQCLKASV